jgi:hypothetical protein
MTKIPQNIHTIFEELRENGFMEPLEITRKHEESCIDFGYTSKYYNMDKIIYKLENGNYLLIRLNNYTIAIEERKSLNFRQNYYFIKYFYNTEDMIKYFEENYSELIEEIPKEPECD